MALDQNLIAQMLRRGRPRPAGPPGGVLPAPEPMAPMGPEESEGPDAAAASADQVRQGLTALSAEYPEARDLLDQFERAWQRWMGGGEMGIGGATAFPAPVTGPLAGSLKGGIPRG